MKNWVGPRKFYTRYVSEPFWGGITLRKSGPVEEADIFHGTAILDGAGRPQFEPTDKCCHCQRLVLEIGDESVHLNDHRYCEGKGGSIYCEGCVDIVDEDDED